MISNEEDMARVIDGCLKNDRQAQHTLFEIYSKPMLGLCQRYTKSTEEAEDCMIEGFLKVFQHISEFQFKSSLETWIRSIMMRTALDHYRANRKHALNESLEDENVVLAEDTNEHEEIITSLQAKMILQLMMKMPEGQRIIFNLHTIDDYTFKDIAEMLEMNANTVRAHYQVARRWLMNELGNKEKQ